MLNFCLFFVVNLSSVSLIYKVPTREARSGEGKKMFFFPYAHQGRMWRDNTAYLEKLAENPGSPLSPDLPAA